MKRIFSLLLVFALLVPCFASATDAPEMSEADVLVALGMLRGTEKGLELDRDVTRAEAVTMLYRISAQEETARTYRGYFSDVPSSHWASGWIERAYEDKYVQGIGGAMFCPNRAVSGVEFTKMLLSMLGYQDITLENCNQFGKESDLLTEDQTNAPLTRDEVAVLCYHAMKARRNSDAPLYQTLTLGREKEAYFLGDMPMSFTDELRAHMPSDQNYMFSPFSVRMALAMAANGAKGATKAEILDTLQIEDLAAFNAESKRRIEQYSALENAQLQVANAIWANQEILKNGFRTDYKSLISSFYHGAAEMTDMSRAVEQINGWVSANTNGKIPGILSKNNLPFAAFLANAVYFKGTWSEPFDAKLTDRAEFTNRDGTKTETDFMHQTEYFEYFEGNGIQMVRLPYRYDFQKDPVRLSMYVILADTDVDAEYYVKTREMSNRRVALSLPKFKTEWGERITAALQDMGIDRAFDTNRADFSAISGEWPLFIENVMHKTYIQVDETGTEAAAVTGIAVGAGAAPSEPVVFTADRPFTYVIYDETNEETLFVGEYAYAKQE